MTNQSKKIKRGLQMKKIVSITSLITAVSIVSPALSGGIESQFRDPSASGFIQNERPKWVEDELIVKIKPSSTSRSIQTFGATSDISGLLGFQAESVTPVFKSTAKMALGAKTLQSKSNAYSEFQEQNQDQNLFIVKVKKEERDQRLEALRENANVDYVLPNYKVYTQAVPNDPYYGNLWGLPTIEHDKLQGLPAYNQSVVVAVLDTGLDLTHEDIQGQYYTNPNEIPGNGIDDDGNGFVDDVNGWNFVSNNASMFDDNGHGTHVAGTIAAASNNGIGISGVAKNAKILPIRVLNGNGGGSWGALLSGMDYAAKMNAQVINLSLGAHFDPSDPGTKRFIDEQDLRFSAISEAQKTAIVIAAGNDHDVNVQNYWPARVNDAITVGSLQRAANGKFVKSSFSNFGEGIDVWAPGSGILSLNSKDSKFASHPSFPGYVSLSGTSMAAPHVAGVAALVKSAYPELTGTQVRTMLQNNVNSSDVQFIESGVVSALNIESDSDPVTGTLVSFEHDHYYIDNGSNTSIDINGFVESTQAGSYTLTLEQGPSILYSTSGNFVAGESANKLLGSIPYPAVSGNGLPNYKIRVVATTATDTTTKVAVVTINHHPDLSKDYAGNALFYGENYSSHPGPMAVPYNTIIDLDGDGIAERITIRTSYISAKKNQLIVTDMEGNAKPGFPYQFDEPYAFNFYRTKPYFKDLDGDGKLEILIVSSTHQRASSGSYIDSNGFNVDVIGSDGVKQISSFSKTLVEDTLFGNSNSMRHMMADYNGDGQDDLIVFKRFRINNKTHLLTNVYTLAGELIHTKTQLIEAFANQWQFDLFDVFPAQGNTPQANKYVLTARTSYYSFPNILYVLDSQFNVVFTNASYSGKVIELKNYKVFDLDKNGEPDIGYVERRTDRKKDEIVVIKNSNNEVAKFDSAGWTSSYSHFQTDFFVGNLVGDDANEIVSANTFFDPNFGTTRMAMILDQSGNQLFFDFLPEDVERLFTLANLDGDEYDELVFAPEFYTNSVRVLNADLSFVKDIKIPSTLSMINQRPAISNRTSPFIAKLTDTGNYNLVISQRKLNIIDLGTADEQDIRWMGGYGHSDNNFAQTPIKKPVSEGMADVSIQLQASFSLRDLTFSSVALTDGTNTYLPTSYNTATGLIEFKDVPNGSYSIEVFTEDWSYTYTGYAQVIVNGTHVSATIPVTRLVKDGEAYIYAKYVTDFDMSHKGIKVYFKNLETGNVVSTTIKGTLVVGAYEYHKGHINLSPGQRFEVTLEGKDSQYRYYTLPYPVTIASDNYYNEIKPTVIREPLRN